MTQQQKVVRLSYYGYNPIHLMGDWFWCRRYSTHSHKFSHWWFHKITDD